MNMATKPLVAVEEYLRMSFEGPDPEFLDGELLERNLGDDPHSSTQANFIGLFHPLKKKFRIHVRPEIHMRLAATRIRIADLAVFLEKPAVRIPSSPPHVVSEIVSLGDRLSEIRDKLDELPPVGDQAHLAGRSSGTHILDLRFERFA